TMSTDARRSCISPGTRLSDASAGAEIAVICGPTAAGKSAIAMWLATRAPLTILSADSRQAYRGFDVGTAKAALADQVRGPHRGIDVADPARRYSAAVWADSAGAWIDEAARASRTPVVVGGTGLYVHALFNPLFAEPVVDSAQRARLQAVLEPLDVEELRR